ncbi:MAG: hypothetical protein QW086_01470 [Pyrobaculum sp.]
MAEEGQRGTAPAAWRRHCLLGFNASKTAVAAVARVRPVVLVVRLIYS